MMVIQQFTNIFDGIKHAQNTRPADAIPWETHTPWQRFGTEPPGSFLSTFEHFLTLQDAGSNPRQTGETDRRDNTGGAREETPFAQERAERVETAAIGTGAPDGEASTVTDRNQVLSGAGGEKAVPPLREPAVEKGSDSSGRSREGTSARGTRRDDDSAANNEAASSPSVRESILAARQGLGRHDVARQEVGRYDDVRKDAVRQDVVRQEVVRRQAALPGNRDFFDKLGFEPNVHADKLKQALALKKKEGISATQAPPDQRKKSGSSFGAVSTDTPADVIRSVGRFRLTGSARPEGEEQPGNQGGSEKHSNGTGAPGAGHAASEKSTAGALFSALRRTAGKAFLRVEESDKLSEGTERTSEARTGTRVVQRGVHRSVSGGLRADVQQVKPEGISVKNNLSELLDAKGDQRKAQAGNETQRGFGELTLAASKYESTALRALSRPDYQIPRNTDEFINEIVRQFTFVARKGGGEAHISLKPDFLGGMKLNLKLNNSEVSSFILVDNPAVKDLITSRLTVLEQGLLQHGLSLGSFQVEVKDSGSGSQAEWQDGKRSAGASIETGRVEEAVESAVLAGAGLPWMSTVVNITV